MTALAGAAAMRREREPVRSMDRNRRRQCAAALKRAHLGATLLIAWLLIGMAGLAAGQVTGAGGPVELSPPEKPAAVVVWGREIAAFRAPYGDLSPQDRARLAEEHILAIPLEGDYRVEVVKGNEGALRGAMIKVNGQRIFGLLVEDVDPDSGETFDAVCTAVANRLDAWLKIRGEQLRWPHLLRGAILAALATAAYGVALWVLVVLAPRWLRRREAATGEPARQVSVGNINVRPYLVALAVGMYKLAAWGLGFALGYLWLAFVLNRFFYSQAWGTRLRDFFVDLISRFGLGALKAIPDIFTVIVILILARLIAKVVHAFFRSAELGSIDSPWLEPESARTTRRLVSALIWVFALIVAYPYIPGSDTAAFKGVSVFLGLMVSLGSAGMVGQVVGGLVVVYSRAFRTGDHVKVGDHEGVVREIGLLSTKLETRTQDEVTIPNAVLLAATTINYSCIARKKGGALVTTKLTIGYDAPWREVHAMLEAAAKRTAHVKTTPAPWVMQSALSDFYPEYILIFAIDRSQDRYAVLSELHGHIQDIFNQSGIQIMSPNFVAQPAEPVLARPEHFAEASANRERID